LIFFDILLKTIIYSTFIDHSDHIFSRYLNDILTQFLMEQNENRYITLIESSKSISKNNFEKVEFLELIILNIRKKTVAKFYRSGGGGA